MRPRLGDIEYNLSLAMREIEKVTSGVIMFSELFLTGYPPNDEFYTINRSVQINDALKKIEAASYNKDILIIIGTPFFDGQYWRNAGLAIGNGEVIHTHYKNCLPNYDVFNDSRYFVAGSDMNTFQWNGQTLAIAICEDIWANTKINLYPGDPLTKIKEAKVNILLHLTASPFEKEKLNHRLIQLKRAATLLGAMVISVNQVGGYNDILFDGQSLVLDKNGDLLDKFPSFKICNNQFDLNTTINQPSKKESEIVLAAISFGLKEYLKYTGFQSVVVGLSGGIDSALVAAIAVKVLGPKKVQLVSMPTKFNSDATKKDTIEMAKRMNCELTTFPIEKIRQLLNQEIKTLFSKEELNEICEQNIQSRVRGLVLMAISNQTQALLLTTGNKSELAMGYATLYGDMSGGLNIIGDLFKTEVYALAHVLNEKDNWIPESIICRPPSAELAAGQQDNDTLPDYDRLDKILNELMIQQLPLNAIREMNDNKDVDLVIKRLENNEFKRFQSPPILKLSSKAFGKGWQYPLVK